MRNVNLLSKNDNSVGKDEMIGRAIGNYRISEEIGRGGMGVVYKAVHLTLEKVVAVKAFSSKSSSKMSIDTLEPVIRFYKEAQTQARLDHPNIISVQDFLKLGDNYFIVMEYVHGESLGKILSRHGAFEPNIAISIFKQILNGIRHAHSKGVIHRDIKPSNFILTPNRVKITDFGVSQLAGDAKLTTTGAVIGTPKYMSPEQILGKNTDHRSDIYSLGITFYEMLTGRVPFSSDNDSDFEIKRGHVELPPPPMSQIKPDIPQELEDLVLRAISKKPEDRFQSVDELLMSLERINEAVKTQNKRDSSDKNKLSLVKTPQKKDDPSEYIGEEMEYDEQGDLSTTGYSALLLSHYRRKSTGVLVFHSHTKLKVYFYGGFLAFAEWGDPRLALGEILVDRSKITKAEQEDSLSFARETGLKIGEALIKLKKITPYELNSILEIQVKEKLINGFQLTSGFYRFYKSGNFFQKILYKIHPLQIIYEGINKYVDREKILNLLEERGSLIIGRDDINSQIGNLTLSSPQELKLIDILKDKPRLEEAISKSPISIDETLKFMYFLNSTALIEFRRVKKEPEYAEKLKEHKPFSQNKAEPVTEEKTKKVESQSVYKTILGNIANFNKPRKITIRK